MASVDQTSVASSPSAFFARIAAQDQPWLSYSEEFLWWSARLAGDTTFHVRVLLRLRGLIDRFALEASIVELARRHEALRTIFPQEHGVIVRKLLPPEVARPTVLELDGERDAWRLVIEEANGPFTITKRPLFRAQILRLAADDHLLQLTVHHLVIDGRSVDILLRELHEVYRAFAHGRPSPLPEPRVTLSAYVAARKRELRTGALDRALRYWRTQLAGAPSLLSLPTDAIRRPARHYHGHTLTFDFPPDQAEAIRQLARRHGVTLFVLLLAVLKLLLSRLSGQSSISIEVPYANRPSTDAEQLVGLLVDLVIMRTELTVDMRLADLLAAVRRTTLGAFDHAGVPVHVLVGALGAHVDASHSALAQVMFNVIDMRPRAAVLQSLGAEQLPLPESPHSKFDLMLTVHVRDGLSCQLLYRRELFSEARMRTFVDQFKHLIAQILADSKQEQPQGQELEQGQPVADYSLVTPQSESVLRPREAAGGFDLIVLTPRTRERQRQRIAGVGELGELCFIRRGDVIPTGHLGRFLPDGQIDCLGLQTRDWDTIDGYTVRFEEVARVLRTHPSVRSTRVLVEANADGVPELVAYIVATVPAMVAAGAAALEESLTEFATDRLPAHQIPRRFFFVDRVPNPPERRS